MPETTQRPARAGFLIIGLQAAMQVIAFLFLSVDDLPHAWPPEAALIANYGQCLLIVSAAVLGSWGLAKGLGPVSQSFRLVFWLMLLGACALATLNIYTLPITLSDYEGLPVSSMVVHTLGILLRTVVWSSVAATIDIRLFLAINLAFGGWLAATVAGQVDYADKFDGEPVPFSWDHDPNAVGVLLDRAADGFWIAFAVIAILGIAWEVVRRSRMKT